MHRPVCLELHRGKRHFRGDLQETQFLSHRIDNSFLKGHNVAQKLTFGSAVLDPVLLVNVPGDAGS